MGDLTANFSRHEFRCKCGCGFDDVSPDLVKGLQQLRDLCGRPVIVNSACRCPEHNRRVGGAAKSRHLEGKAADIVIRGLTPRQMADLAEQIDVFQKGAILIYPARGFIHVDVRGARVRITY